MNTSINNLILQWNELKNSANSCINSQNFEPVHLTGLHGSSFAFFLSQLSNSNHFRNLSKSQYEQNYSLNTNSDLLIVVPSEYEANIVYTDISSVFPQAECYVFPWWGTIPYRPVAKGSSVFGKRAGILSKLLHKNKTVNFENHTRIFIVTQRSFISPLPKPEYLKDFSFKLKKGDVLDTVKISDKLSKLGYTRVSKVTVRGEFSLRGEVLDIFVPCDENASRVIFDFDTIEKIKSFDATNQATIDTKEEVFVHPLKEIIWTDELVSIAEKKLQEYDESSISEDKDFEINANNFTSDDKWYSAHLAFTEEAKKYSEKMLLELSVSGESEGEEFLYQLLWDKRYSFIDYLDNQTFVVFYYFDRMKNALQAINREYIGMYRKARYQLPVLPPDLVNFDFDNLLENVSRCIQIHTILQEEDTYIKLPIEASRSFFGNINYLKEELTNLQKENWNIFIY
ncbi:MAG: transcription-repair coupling factor, partial [Treponema sp.]|nr:transcription-repair coupling factor [Treponema sp.]